MTVEIATELGITDIVPTLVGILHDTNLDDNLRVSAFRALVKLSPEADAVVKSGLKDTSESVRLAAVEIMVASAPESSVPQLRQLLADGTIRTQQTALRLLGSIKTDDARQALLERFARLKNQSLPSGAALDLLLAAEKAGTPE